MLHFFVRLVYRGHAIIRLSCYITIFGTTINLEVNEPNFDDSVIHLCRIGVKEGGSAVHSRGPKKLFRTVTVSLDLKGP